jgi:hypothetical protein
MQNIHYSKRFVTMSLPPVGPDGAAFVAKWLHAEVARLADVDPTESEVLNNALLAVCAVYSVDLSQFAPEPDPSPEMVVAADALKAEGNDLAAQGDMMGAIERFTLAISIRYVSGLCTVPVERDVFQSTFLTCQPPNRTSSFATPRDQLPCLFRRYP